jgi:hypothetical protein
MEQKYKNRIKKLSPEDRAQFFDHIRSACFNLATCWDELRAAEEMIDGIIETDDIQGLTGELDNPPVTSKLTDKIIMEGL